MVGGDGSEGGDDGVGKFLCAGGAANVAGDVAVLAVDALDGCRRDPAQDRSATKRGVPMAQRRCSQKQSKIPLICANLQSEI